MTRENAKKLLPIIKAYSEGKEIQHFWENKWEDIKFPQFVDLPSSYRIKPESKYRPFKSVEECWDEMKKHQPFGWFIDIRDKYYTHITLLGKSTDFDYLFNIYTFADGTPFGIKKEE